MISFDSERLPERVLDDTNWRILAFLQEDARLSFAEIGRRVNMSSPAVAERVQRLEKAGIIEGYRVKVNYAKLGFPVRAAIHVATLGHDDVASALQVMNAIPEILECHRLTGSDCYLITVAVVDMARLEQVIQQLEKLGRTITSMILRTPIESRSVVSTMPIEP